MATPAALLVGTSKGAQCGVLIKGGEYLEVAGKVDTVVFDKTGTLTLGRPSVTDVDTRRRALAPDELLRLAGAVEKGSEHPLGEAIVTEAKQASASACQTRGFEDIAGKGVRAWSTVRPSLLGNRSLVAEQPARAVVAAVAAEGRASRHGSRD